ncbi:MAG: hypothetical protein GX063_05590, partial [Firmicutes bacterium]|nr:hypothetical protein [Bacillota bacterium]
MKNTRLVIGILLALLVSLALVSAVPALARDITIGVSIRSLSEERWAREQILMKEKGEELGVEVIFTDANNDE